MGNEDTAKGIAAAPLWTDRWELDADGRQVRVDPARCVCGELTYVDAATGLCRPCWRVWRFAGAPAAGHV